MATSALGVLRRLIDGNRRFVSGEGVRDLAQEHVRRRELLADQAPCAIVLGCSDSRVPAEMVFDQGLGDLFVIRVAGNIVAPSQVGSIEFAAARYNVRLVVVLGHSHYGAVLASLEELERPSEHRSPNLGFIVNSIVPHIEPLLAAVEAGKSSRARQHPCLRGPPAARLGAAGTADPRQRAAGSRRRVLFGNGGGRLLRWTACVGCPAIRAP
jgi:carbonic anhydrase